MNFWDEKGAKRLFPKLPFYNAFIEKPRIKGLKNIEQHELPFYDQLSTVKTLKVATRYARSYNKIKIITQKIFQLNMKLVNHVLKICFKDLLNEVKSFKYQITRKVFLRKYKERTDLITNCKIKKWLN